MITFPTYDKLPTTEDHIIDILVAADTKKSEANCDALRAAQEAAKSHRREEDRLTEAALNIGRS